MIGKSSNKLSPGGQIVLIPHEEIYPNPNQPRRHFDYAELEGLAQSIRANGLLQPINVRARENGGYELISGERRLRASRIVGAARVPCIVMAIDDKKSALFALLENLQRKDLDFFEEAAAVEKLISVYGLNQEEAAGKLGKAQSTLSNKLRLLKLPEDIRVEISEAGLTERHARALLKLENSAQQRKALNIVIARQLNVAETEKVIEQLIKVKPLPKRIHMRIFKDVRIFINTLESAVDTMRKAGIEASSDKNETEEYIEYLVRIPKAGKKQQETGSKVLNFQKAQMELPLPGI